MMARIRPGPGSEWVGTGKALAEAFPVCCDTFAEADEARHRSGRCRRPVRWEAVVKRLASEGVRTYVEVCPGTVLAGLVRKIDRNATVASVEDPAGVEAPGAVLAGA
jgi:malonyl CoA-acyl carrier protein transacylase